MRVVAQREAVAARFPRLAQVAAALERRAIPLAATAQPILAAVVVQVVM
jgi:hypothetical protein